MLANFAALASAATSGVLSEDIEVIHVRVRVTMDGADYFINVLSNGLRGVVKQ